MRRGDRVLILAHRGELLDQAQTRSAGRRGSAALRRKRSRHASALVPCHGGIVQSLMREKRLGQFPADYFGTIIIDEAHHCLSDSYQRVLGHFKDARVLVDSTPDREICVISESF